MYSVVHCYEQESLVDYRMVTLERVCHDMGVRVKRNSFGESCQNVRRETNISVQPSVDLSSVLEPTVESSEAIKPILSNFGSRLRPRKIPSLFIYIRHSPLGLPSFGVFLDASVVR